MNRSIARSLPLLLLLASLAAAGDDWRARCYTPTALAKIGERYFLIDCWHHRALWSNSLHGDVARWKTLDEELAGPHSLDSDGTLYVVDDTGRGGLRVYAAAGDGFRLVQRIAGLGLRPHRVRYDRPTAAFYVLAADSQQISKLSRQGERLSLVYTKKLAFLRGNYTRSMTIADDAMFFVSGPGAVIKTSYRDDRYRVLASYRIPEKLAGLRNMNDLFRSDDGWWYVTATPTRMVRVRDLESLQRGECEDVYGQLGLRGTPYYLSRIDGRDYVPQISEYSGIVSFVHREGRIADVRTLCDFGPPTPADERRKASGKL